MTAQILAAELTNLIQESKRKNPELRNAADKSLQDLKALPSTSEAQLAADLSRRPYFISPFIVGCNSRSPKFATPSIVCILRLAVSHGLPRERLKDVLEALRECSTLGLEIQLKILQAVPTLVQNYGGDIQGVLLSLIIEICATLCSGKNPALTNTAAATLQQVVIAIFDKSVAEDEKALEIPTTAEVPSDDGPISVRPAAQDGYKVFHDLCLLADGGKPHYINLTNLSQTSALELIGAVMNSHGVLVSTHKELTNVLRTVFLPFAIRSLSDKTSFSVVLRVMRILDLVICRHLDAAPAECEIILGLLNHMLDPDAAAAWKRTLCLEVWRGIYSDPKLILGIFRRFDASEGQKNIVQDNVSAFVRLATEKPTLIGLGNQSSAPVGDDIAKDSTGEQAAAGAGAMAEVIGSSVSVTTNASTSLAGIGLSTQWSSPRAACLDQLDKSDPPSLPETYIPSLILTCINNLSESLAKFILPLTVHSEGRGKRKPPRGKQAQDADVLSESSVDPLEPLSSEHTRPTRSQSYFKKAVPVNPLGLESHSAYQSITAAAGLINECWPAVLATSSTFLYATLDADYYRTLVRSIQKFTQVAGLLRLGTPRDAFLTTLGKAAVPPHILATNLATPQTPASAESPQLLRNKSGLLSVESLTGQLSTSSEKSHSTVVENTPSSLNTRNLLCLRALLNLAIALGPTLDQAWSIIFETLQQADIVLAIAPRSSTSRIDTGVNFNSEVNAVQAAASRLFESTVEYPDDAFLQVLGALCGLLQTQNSLLSRAEVSQPSGSQAPRHQRRVGSYSGISVNTESDKHDYLFALGKIGDLVTLNLNRLTGSEPSESGWDIVRIQLASIIKGTTVSGPARLLAAEILSRIVRDSISTTANQETSFRDIVQRRALSALLIENFYHIPAGKREPVIRAIDLEVHKVIVETLRTVLEQSGESLVAGWNLVFKIILTTFWEEKVDTENGRKSEDLNDENTNTTLIAVKLSRAAFSSVQLICSDFLSAVPDTDMSKLVDILHRFCSQEEDLNLSLTTTTLFWNVSDFLHNRMESYSVENVISGGSDTALFSHIMVAAREGSVPAIWLQLLSRLTLDTVDDRVEVRNGAIQTVFRIFENCGESFSPKAWQICIQSVLVGMIQLNLEAQLDARDSNDEADGEDLAEKEQDIKEWNQSTKWVMEGMSKLFAAYIDPIRQSPDFTVLWQRITGFFEEFLRCEDHEINAAVFSALNVILAKLSPDNTLQAQAMDQVSSLWINHFPSRHSELKGMTNEKAFEEYLESFKELYRLTADDVDTSTIPKFCNNIMRCICDADSPAYASDVDSMTRVQQYSIDCISLLQTKNTNATSIVIKTLADIVRLPFTKLENHVGRGLSYVALSKTAMQIMRNLVIGHIQKEELFESGAILLSLSSVIPPIALKYQWKQQGRPPGICQEATSTALALLKSAVLRINQTPSLLRSPQLFWNEVIKIADGIMSANTDGAPLDAPIEMDEAFDIRAFETLRDLITPLLGSESLSDDSRRSYCQSIFLNSLIHESQQIGKSLLETGSFADLYTIHLGRTFDPPPATRIRMSYTCLSELVSLVRVYDSLPEQVRLAQAAAPYLILRAALPVKAYISDQPLRGRMPIPQSQRDEILLTLRELKELRSEPDAMPETQGAKSIYRKHLHRLYPLMIKAIFVAKRDPVILDALRECVDVVGRGFVDLDV